MNLLAGGLGTEGTEAGTAAGCAPAGRAPAPPGLPCRNSNNSTQKKGYRVYEVRSHFINRATGEVVVGENVTLRDSAGRWVDDVGDGVIGVWDGLTSAEARAAFSLRQNVEAFVAHWGREHCGFFTLTDGEGLNPFVFARRWNSFLTHEGSWIVAFIRVLEPQRNRRPHYHFLIAAPWDMQPDLFDWRAFDEARLAREQGRMGDFRLNRKRYVESAAPEVRAMWKRLRDKLPKYGLGRAEFLPVRKVGAIPEYIGKYLEKGYQWRVNDWKGARRIEYDRRRSGEWKRCSRVFAWVSPGAAEWRARVGRLAGAVGIREYDGLRRVFGKRWAYQLRASIITGSEEEFRTAVSLLAAKRIFDPNRQCLSAVT